MSAQVVSTLRVTIPPMASIEASANRRPDAPPGRRASSSGQVRGPRRRGGTPTIGCGCRSAPPAGIGATLWPAQACSIVVSRMMEAGRVTRPLGAASWTSLRAARGRATTSTSRVGVRGWRSRLDGNGRVLQVGDREVQGRHPSRLRPLGTHSGSARPRRRVPAGELSLAWRTLVTAPLCEAPASRGSGSTRRREGEATRPHPFSIPPRQAVERCVTGQSLRSRASRKPGAAGSALGVDARGERHPH